MRRNEPQHELPEEKRQYVGLWVSLFICAALAVTGFWLRYVLEETGHPILGEISLHLGIAFVVAASVIGVIEIRAHRIGVREMKHFRDQVSRNVFQALLGRIVPIEVVDEINDILHSDIVRRDCKYRIFFKRPYAGMAPGYFVIRREVTYTVENLLNRPVKFTARSSHSEDLDLKEAGWTQPFHEALFVDQEVVELIEGINLVAKGNSTQLAHEISLGPRGSREITIHGEEPNLVSAGRNTYLQATPVIGIEVEIWNDFRESIGDSEVHMNHPVAPGPRPGERGRFISKRAFLPGQGFQVIWKQSTEETKVASEVLQSAQGTT